jgi:hypothetical protein
VPGGFFDDLESVLGRIDHDHSDAVGHLWYLLAPG